MIYLDFSFQEILDYKNNPLMLNFLVKNQLSQITSFPVDFRKKQVTSLFMISEIPVISRREPEKIISEFLEKYLKDKILFNYHKKNYEIKIQKLWENRKKLAEKLKVPLYVVFWNDENVILFEYYPNKNFQIMPWKQYVEKFNRLKSLSRQTKPLMYARKSLFNQILEKYNVTGGGDLDGFLVKKNEIVIFEFSTRNVSCDKILNHNINYFINEDKRRWEALFILKENLSNSNVKTRVNVIIWSPCCKEFLLVNRDLKKENGKIVFDHKFKLTNRTNR